jgi:hypothetical protein
MFGGAAIPYDELGESGDLPFLRGPLAAGAEVLPEVRHAADEVNITAVKSDYSFGSILSSYHLYRRGSAGSRC